MRSKQLVKAVLATAIAALLAASSRASPDPLVVEREIPLPNVSGRIDHLALDLAHRRLFVAELGNGSVEAVDLASGRSIGRIPNLNEPQGVGYLPARDELAVATGGDGMLRLYRAGDLQPAGALKLGTDADNVRVDPQTGSVVVGFGSALAVVDPARRAIVRTIGLPAHPEGFQFQGGRAFVNLPGADILAVVDLAHGRDLTHWRNAGPRQNFPMALEPNGRWIAVAYRSPPRLAILDAATGAVIQQLPACGDADDLFMDPSRRRLYVICGAGAVDVFGQGRAGYAPVGRLATREGARTGLFSPELDRLFVAARAGGGASAAILVLRPAS